MGFFFSLFCRLKLKLKGAVWTLPFTAKVKAHRSISEQSSKVYFKHILAQNENNNNIKQV